MLTLLGERFAPITSSFGFLRLPLGEAAAGLARWRRRLHGNVDVTPLHGRLSELLPALEPLTGGVRPRELLVATAGEWTALFDCGVQGGDPVSSVGFLCQDLACQGMSVATVPHTLGTGLEPLGRYGGVQWQLYGPLRNFLNYVRGVSVANDDGRWRFDAIGTVQPYERVEVYQARKVRDRFTTELMAAYCEELGVRLFDEYF
jgi:hypothetical protein